jgi:hypothetical protein
MATSLQADTGVRCKPQPQPHIVQREKLCLNRLFLALEPGLGRIKYRAKFLGISAGRAENRQ